jgi:uncharacterized protein YbbK (DUF523 family)
VQNRVRIGVSACLVGEKVRYDGGHKYDPYITGTVGQLFALVPVCPEVGCGLSVPREPMRLEGDPLEPRLVVIRGNTDLTEQMLAWCREKVAELEREGLGGFIFKKGSPSCGLRLVPVYREGNPAVTGQGLFAAAVTARFPSLPVTEDRDLESPEVREQFIERVSGNLKAAIQRG